MTVVDKWKVIHIFFVGYQQSFPQGMLNK